MTDFGRNNAGLIQNIKVSPTAPTDEQGFEYDAAAELWTPKTINARQIQGKVVHSAAPTADQVLRWIAANNRYEAATPLKIAAQGIPPTVSGWDTDPTNLNNATDGDPDTVTGTGSTTLGGSGTFGYVELDLGQDGPYVVGAKIGKWSTTASTWVVLNTKADGTNWSIAAWNFIESVAKTTEYVTNSLMGFSTSRYLQFRFYINGAATAYAKIYEIYAYKLQ